MAAGIAVWVAAVLLVSACQAQPLPAKSASASLAGEAALLARIDAEVGGAPCSSSTQCRTLPIGAKACGGPARWMAWSTTTGRADQLQAWSAQLADLQRRRFEATGMMSTCSIVPDPGAVCRTGRCVLSTRDLGR
ncbi:MAG: hypothetical protein A3E25_23120 [Burkholderiales bacterium RIFCSPHIGHO2_12_FULL_69_20]|nr:MAG: hypothetical protein A3E25_23120 [Burkholderiales bacterium RIFCSPHIGHO2_12_FULL_69_20]